MRNEENIDNTTVQKKYIRLYVWNVGKKKKKTTFRSCNVCVHFTVKARAGIPGRNSGFRTCVFVVVIG